MYDRPVSIDPLNLFFNAIDLEGTSSESGLRTISGLIHLHSEKIKKPIIGILPSFIEMSFASVEIIMSLALNIIFKSVAYVLYLIDCDNASEFFEYFSTKMFQMTIQSSYVFFISSVHFFTLGFKCQKA